jgi:hypothetical protein
MDLVWKSDEKSIFGRSKSRKNKYINMQFKAAEYMDAK